MKIVNGRTIFSQSTHDRYVVAVDVGGTNMEGAVVDLSGSIVLQKHMASQGSDVAEIRLIRLINSLFEESGFEKGQFAGIALGVPGVTDSTGQWITLAPGLGWHKINIGKLMEDTFALPTWAENDVNAFLKGEHLLGSMAKVQNGLAITIGTGIGASLLIRGEIYKGSRGAAGEMGYWILDSSLDKQDNRSYGQFEAYAAAPGIARRAQELARNGSNHGILGDLVAGDLSKITAETVFRAAALGDVQAQKVVQDTIAVLGMTLSNLSTVLDIEKIVIGGGVALAGELLITPLQERMNRLNPYPPEIVQSTLGSGAIILGATAGLLERI